MANRFDEIAYLKRLGLNKNQILDRLNRRNDTRNLSRAELIRIGFAPERVNTILKNQRLGRRTQSAADDSWGAVVAGRKRLKAQQQRERERRENPPLAGPDDPAGKTADDIARENRESAFTQLKTWLDQYGLGSLSGKLQEMITAGQTDAATLQLELQETNEWKQRFKGNEILRQKGLGVLSPAEYLNLERSYASVMRQFGMPAGFYDKTEDFVNFIGNGVSPTELAERASAAKELVSQVDPAQRQLLSSMYGVGEGDIAAYFLDAKKAQPILQKQLSAVQTGAAAQRAGIVADFADATRFERLNDQGVGAEQAAQGYGQIAQEMDTLTNLSKIWGGGDEWTLDDAEDATFFGNAAATQERRRLVQQERAAFSGASGFDSRVSGRRSSAGSF